LKSFGYENIRSKVVYYDLGNYNYEIIEFGEEK